MKKKNKKTLIIVGLIMLVGIFATLIFMNPFGQAVAGSSTLGIQKVEFFKSSSECFDSSSGDLWVYTLRGGGLGQWASGGVTPSEAGDKNSGKEIPEETLKIDTRFEQFCEYPLVKNNNAVQVYTLSDPIEWNSPILGDVVQKCINKASEYCSGNYFAGKYSGVFKCWCSEYRLQTGAVGSSPNFNNPSTKTDILIGVEADGESYSEAFSSDARIKGKIGNNVCAIWQGNTVTGTVCGLPQEDVRPAYVKGEWKLLSEDKYQTYTTSWTSLNVQFNANGNKDGIQRIISDLNNKANSFLGSNVKFGTISQPTDQVNAKIVKELDSLIEYPILTLYVKASWLGVVTPIMEPKIKSASSECFGSGRQGNIKVIVENIGNERGEVDIYGSCPSGFEVERKSVSFQAKEEKTIYLEITGTTNEEKLEGKCTIYADAIENIKDIKVDVCVTGHTQCTEGEEWCENKNRFHCPDPIYPELKENCVAQGKVCNYANDGTTFCADSENYCEIHPEDSECGGSGKCGAWIKMPEFDIGKKHYGGQTIIPDIWCLISNFFMKFRVIFSIVLGILGAIFGSLFSMKLIEKQKLKNKWWIAILVGVVFGVAVGFLAYIYFWIGVLVLITLGLIKSFIPGI